KQHAFARESEHYKAVSISLVKAQAVFFPLLLLLIGLSTLITVYVGGIQVIQGNITSGNIAEFIVYVNQLTFPAMSLAWVTSLVQRAAASQKRINEFLKTQPSIVSPPSAPHKLHGHIQFKDVSFTYPDTGITALQDVSFEVQAGKMLAIIGKTGSGKSTIASLLMRMYDVTTGTIQLDGIDIRQLNLQNMRAQMGYVPQDVFLFSDTLARNIAFGRDTEYMPEIEAAAKAAAVYDNIIGFEKG